MTVALRAVGLVTLFVAVVVALPQRHECVHDAVRRLPGYGANAERINVSYAFDTSATTRSFAAQQSSSFQSLRIQVFFDQGDCSAGTCGHCTAVGDTVPTYESAGATTTCQTDDVLTTEKRAYIVDRLMPAAKDFFQRALNVARVSGNLVVSGSSTCGQSPGTAIPASHQSTGVADADFVAYVTAVPKADRSSATVAWAAACRRDSADRPLVAHVNFIPAKLTNAVNLTSVDQANDEATAVHEIAHALGFSAPFFGDRGHLALDGTTMVPSGGTTTATSSTLGKSVTYLTSPRVVREARAYFGCDTLIGGEIEDQGGSGTAGSHWEKRIFNDDSMSGISTGVLSYHSRLTLAFFEDTGHYTANYDAADTRMAWGKGKGCAFAENKCDTLGTNDDNSEFCFDTNTQNTYCTFDRLARGYCGVGDYGQALPSHQQYFSGAPSIGGAVYHSDYCPTVLPYGNRICIDPTTSDSQDVYGNTFSATSRCFDSNLLQSGRSTGSTRRETRCFVPECDGVRLRILVKGVAVTCPADGSAGTADLSALNGQYSGSITCPQSSVFGCAAGVTPPPTSGGGTSPTPAATPSPPAGPGTPPSTPTPQTAPTPAPNADLVPTPAPPSLPLSCADRVSCARTAMAMLPQCRGAARAIADCFGTDCDTQMENYLRAAGVYSNCTSNAAQTAYQGACIEGRAGVADLCYLALSPAASVGVWGPALFVCLAAALLAVGVVPL